MIGLSIRIFYTKLFILKVDLLNSQKHTQVLHHYTDLSYDFLGLTDIPINVSKMQLEGLQLMNRMTLSIVHPLFLHKSVGL